jgi:hypothetical protein
MENDPQNPQVLPKENGPEPRVRFEGQLLTQSEIDEIKRQRALREAAYKKGRLEEWLRTEEGRLCLEFYQKFQEYRKYVGKNSPPWCAEGAKADSPEHQLFKEGLKTLSDHEHERAEQNRKNLRRAHLAARCEHRHADGTRCGSPRMGGKKLCYRHERMEEARTTSLDLGVLEDAESIQVAIMKLQRAVIDGVLDGKQTSQLASLIRLAAWNAGRMPPAERIAEKEEQDGADGESAADAS